MDNQQNPVGNGNSDGPSNGFSGEFTNFLNTGLTDGDLNGDPNMPNFGLLNSSDIPSGIGSGNTTDAIRQQLADIFTGNSQPFQSNRNGDITGSAQPQSQLGAGAQGSVTVEGQSSWLNRVQPQEMQQSASGVQQYSHQQAFVPSGQGLFRFKDSQCFLRDSFDLSNDYPGGNENINTEIPGTSNRVNDGRAWSHPNPSMISQQGGDNMAFSMSPPADTL